MQSAWWCRPWRASGARVRGDQAVATRRRLGRDRLALGWAAELGEGEARFELEAEPLQPLRRLGDGAQTLERSRALAGGAIEARAFDVRRQAVPRVVARRREL